MPCAVSVTNIPPAVKSNKDTCAHKEDQTLQSQPPTTTHSATEACVCLPEHVYIVMCSREGKLSIDIRQMLTEDKYHLTLSSNASGHRALSYSDDTT